MVIIQTNKTLQRRKERDAYATPYSFALSVCRNVLHNLVCTSDCILDPGCGDGVWGKAIKTVRPHAFVIGLDIEESKQATYVYDAYYGSENFLDIHHKLNLQQPDLIIGNPPYSLVHDFVDQSLRILKPWGRVVFLLRLDFLASVKRLDRWYSNDKKPEIVRVSSSRISFDGSGKSDDTNYALFQWVNSPVDHTTISWFDWKRG